MLPLLLIACHHDTGSGLVDTAPEAVPWSAQLPPLADEIGPTRGYAPARAIVHLHSPWSHDACDDGGGAENAQCLADLRYGLCATHVDAAFLTDHPSYAAYHTYDELFEAQEGDTPVSGQDGQVYASQIHCDDGQVVTWLPGIEDELMPVGLDRQVSDDFDENDAIYNASDAEAVLADQDAGAMVITAHTEGRTLEDLEALQDLGLQGTELFNLHAMFDPTKREEDLGLDPWSWLSSIAPFTSTTDTAEPDLLFLAVYSEQTPSLERWDALMARGPMVGTAGTDAHENVLPALLRDGERGDSYRRMMRWFSNVLLVDSGDPSAYEQALRAGRVYAAFEVLGTPEGFDFHLETGGEDYEMGSDAPEGTLVVGCPTLSEHSPRGLDAPEISATVFKDGAAWASGCGEHETDGPGVYRVRVDMVPWHLRDFLGKDPDPWLVSYPWIYSNGIRVGL